MRIDRLLTPTAATRGHPCGVAYHALKDAGHAPEVQRGYGWNVLPDALKPVQGARRPSAAPARSTCRS